MFIGGIFGRVGDMIQSQLMPLGTDNLLAQAYNILNIILQIYALLLNVMTDGAIPR